MLLGSVLGHSSIDFNIYRQVENIKSIFIIIIDPGL